MFVMFVYKIVCRSCQLTIPQLTISTQGLPKEMEILTATAIVLGGITTTQAGQ